MRTKITINKKYSYFIDNKKGVKNNKIKNMAKIADVALTAMEVMTDSKTSKISRLIRELMGIFVRR